MGYILDNRDIDKNILKDKRNSPIDYKLNTKALYEVLVDTELVALQNDDTENKKRAIHSIIQEYGVDKELIDFYPHYKKNKENIINATETLLDSIKKVDECRKENKEVSQEILDQLKDNLCKFSEVTDNPQKFLNSLKVVNAISNNNYLEPKKKVKSKSFGLSKSLKNIKDKFSKNRDLDKDKTKSVKPIKSMINKIKKVFGRG